MAKNNRTFKAKFKHEKLVNRAIYRKFDSVRIVDSPNKNDIGVHATLVAVKMAESANLDLVLMNEKSAGGICKIIDYKKFLYEAKKKEKSQSANTQKTVVKEIRLGLDISNNDMEYRAKKAIGWLNGKSLVKISLRIRGGRHMIRKGEGGGVIRNFVEMVIEMMENKSTVQYKQQPQLDGRNWTALISIGKIKNKLKNDK